MVRWCVLGVGGSVMSDMQNTIERFHGWLQEGAELYQQYGKEIDIRQLSYRTLRGYIQRVGWQLEEALKAAEPKWKILAVEDLPNVEYPQQSRADEIHQS